MLKGICDWSSLYLFSVSNKLFSRGVNSTLIGGPDFLLLFSSSAFLIGPYFSKFKFRMGGGFLAGGRDSGKFKENRGPVILITGGLSTVKAINPIFDIIIFTINDDK